MRTRLKRGFKQSSLGLIPNDWEVKTLGDIVDVQVGKDLKESNYSAVYSSEFKYPVYSNSVENFGLYGFYNIEEYKGSSTTVVGRGVGLGTAFTRNGSFGAIGRLLVLFPKKEIEARFVTEFFNSNVKVFAESSGIPQLTGEQIARYKIAIPGKQEQSSIANLLWTWDRAISHTTNLIAQKELRKKWLMQQLLTGKKRLKGFKGEWSETRLGDVVENFSRRNSKLIDARVYSVTNTNGFVLQSEHFAREVAGEDLSSYKIIKENEFAYNPARINVGSIGYFTSDIGIISSLYVCFKTKASIDDFYLQQLLQLDLTKHKIDSYGEGGVRIYLWFELFAKIRIQIPSLKEQLAIVQVLRFADSELKLLNQKLDKLKEQKKGLMQILLTGKKRIMIKPNKYGK